MPPSEQVGFKSLDAVPGLRAAFIKLHKTYDRHWPVSPMPPSEARTQPGLRWRVFGDRTTDQHRVYIHSVDFARRAVKRRD